MISGESACNQLAGARILVRSSDEVFLMALITLRSERCAAISCGRIPPVRGFHWRANLSTRRRSMPIRLGSCPLASAVTAMRKHCSQLLQVALPFPPRASTNIADRTSPDNAPKDLLNLHAVQRPDQRTKMDAIELKKRRERALGRGRIHKVTMLDYSSIDKSIFFELQLQTARKSREFLPRAAPTASKLDM